MGAGTGAEVEIGDSVYATTAREELADATRRASNVAPGRSAVAYLGVGERLTLQLPELDRGQVPPEMNGSKVHETRQGGWEVGLFGVC